MDYKKRLSGIFVPLTTPFYNEKIHLAQLEENILRYNETALAGYMILGGNGEYLGLTEEESLQVLHTIIKNKAKDITAVAGTGRESAYATIEFIKKAADKGAEFASIITPFYYVKVMSDEALIRYYETIADQSPLPLVVYNSPEYAAGVKVSQDCIRRLSMHENIVLMKNSSIDSMLSYTSAIPKESNFYFHVGRVVKLFEGLSEGAIGATLAISNYLPALCCEAYHAFVSGQKEKSRQLCERLGKINKAVSPNGVAGVKYAMSLLGIPSGETRIPLLPVKEEKKGLIRASLQEEGLI